MYIVAEKKKKVAEANPDPWQPADKRQFVADVRKFIQMGARFTLFHVGPDHTLVGDAHANKGGSGMFLFTDKDGLTVGFHESSMGNRISKLISDTGKATCYSFFVGRKEVKLWVEY